MKFAISAKNKKLSVVFSTVGDPRATGLVKWLIKTIEEHLFCHGTEKTQAYCRTCTIENYEIRKTTTVTQQSLNCSHFEPHFEKRPYFLWHNLEKPPISIYLDWNKTRLETDLGYVKKKKEKWGAETDAMTRTLPKTSRMDISTKTHPNQTRLLMQRIIYQPARALQSRLYHVQRNKKRLE